MRVLCLKYSGTEACVTRGRAPSQHSGIGVSGGPTEIGPVVTPSIDKYFRLRGAVLAPIDGNGSESVCGE